MNQENPERMTTTNTSTENSEMSCSLEKSLPVLWRREFNDFRPYSALNFNAATLGTILN